MRLRLTNCCFSNLAEFVPELVSLSGISPLPGSPLLILSSLLNCSGITVEMYCSGLFLKHVLENLSKSTIELKDLLQFQKTLEFTISDINLLKKVLAHASLTFLPIIHSLTLNLSLCPLALLLTLSHSIYLNIFQGVYM
jgi:hypothetical protein